LNLNTIITDTEKMLRRLIGEDVLLSTHLEPSLGPVKADPGQLEQILMNLALNARDAMPQGGKITIETSNIELDETYCRRYTDVQPGWFSMLAVSDNGSGIDEKNRAHIFEPFFTTKSQGQGTGLGLATVHGIVKQSGGHIELYSELKIGTTFKIYLPQVGVLSSGNTLQTEVRPIPRGHEVILLVEDEEAVRSLARHVLQSCGYAVLEARDGREAIQIAEKQESIDILVSDVVMPHLGGRQLAEKIAAVRPDCKVLFLSGYTNDAVVRHGVLEAEFAFLQKPFTPSALARKVRSVLDEKKSRK
jgi:CheY-like chemotaxis protein